MSKSHNSLPTSNTEPQPSEFVPESSSGLAAAGDGEAFSEFEMDNPSDLGGHTLLSRAPQPLGRRSLFRR